MATLTPAPTSTASSSSISGSAASVVASLSSTFPPTPTTATTDMSDSEVPTDTQTANQETASAAGPQYSFSSSSIVRVAIAAGIIVLCVCALVVFFRVSSWIRYRRRLHRQTVIKKSLAAEQQAHAFELAAWSDTPGQAPIAPHPSSISSSSLRRFWRRVSGKGSSRPNGGGVPNPGEGLEDMPVKGKNRNRRGRVNAYAVYEWEGTPV